MVDDEPMVLELVASQLADIGLEVVTASNGRQALELVTAAAPDLVITDIVMPDMEGMQLLKEISRRRPGVPAIVMSGNPVGMSFLDTARFFGARGALRKPFSADELKVAVESVAGGA